MEAISYIPILEPSNAAGSGKLYVNQDGELKVQGSDISRVDRLDLSRTRTPTILREIRAIGEHFPYLELLDLSNQRVKDIGELGKLLSLRRLIIRSNHIHSIQVIGQCKLLEALEAEENEISEVPDSFSSLVLLSRLLLADNCIKHVDQFSKLAFLPSLTELSIKGNPMVLASDGILSILKRIETLDGHSVTLQQRVEAQDSYSTKKVQSLEDELHMQEQSIAALGSVREEHSRILSRVEDFLSPSKGSGIGDMDGEDSRDFKVEDPRPEPPSPSLSQITEATRSLDTSLERPPARVTYLTVPAMSPIGEDSHPISPATHLSPAPQVEVKSATKEVRQPDLKAYTTPVRDPSQGGQQIADQPSAVHVKQLVLKLLAVAIPVFQHMLPPFRDAFTFERIDSYSVEDVLRTLTELLPSLSPSSFTGQALPLSTPHRAKTAEPASWARQHSGAEAIHGGRVGFGDLSPTDLQYLSSSAQRRSPTASHLPSQQSSNGRPLTHLGKQFVEWNALPRPGLPTQNAAHTSSPDQLRRSDGTNEHVFADGLSASKTLSSQIERKFQNYQQVMQRYQSMVSADSLDSQQDLAQQIDFSARSPPAKSKRAFASDLLSRQKLHTTGAHRGRRNVSSFATTAAVSERFDQDSLLNPLLKNYRRNI